MRVDPLDAQQTTAGMQEHQFRRSNNDARQSSNTMNDPTPTSDAPQWTEVTPRVSVVMPVKDAERFLDEALATARHQTVTDIEILVVLNGSTDASEAIAMTHSAEDARVKVEHCPNIGASQAMNWGVNLARAPWIARLDADDIWLPRKLEKQLELIDANPDIGAVATFGDIISEDGRVVARFSAGGPTSRDEFEQMRNESLIFLLSPSLMFSREISSELGGHQVSLGTAAEDVDFWNRIADNHLILSVPEVLVHYRVHTGSASSLRYFTQALNTRMIEYNMKRRRNGENELGIGDYKKVESSWSLRRKIRVSLRDRSRFYYRRGGALLANKNWRGAWWLLASTLLYPLAPIKKVRRQAMLLRKTNGPT